MKASRTTPARAAALRPPSTLRLAVLPVAAALAALAASTATQAATVKATSARILEVTVFPDRAELTREARLEVPAGASTVEFAGLPWAVEPDSLRATARGVPASLGAVELKQEAREPEESPDYLAAQDEVKRIEGAIAVVDAEAETDKVVREMLASLKAATVQRESERMGEGRADPASLQAMLDLVRTGLQDLGGRRVQRDQRRSRLLKDLEVARAKLAAARPAGAVRTRTAGVEVEAQRAGTLTVRLSYLSPGASWRPAYRAVLEPDGAEVSLAAEAVVRQTTGEDWTGVALRLSTAAPARGVRPPDLTSWLLRPLEPRPIPLSGVMKSERGAAEGAADLKALPAAPLEFRLDSAEDSVRQDAAVVRSSYNVAFEVPGASDVPADGREHRVGLRQERLSGKREYLAVPALGAAAYLVVKGEAPAGYPLLAGPVRVFAGGAYLGGFDLPETAPAGPLAVPFGVDNRIRVERAPLPQERTREGITGRERRVACRFRTALENLLDRPVEVVLEDRVPVSEDERIVVETESETTSGWTEVKDRPGVMRWTVPLDPRGRKEVLLSYSVRFPRDLIVPGIE